MESTAQCAMIVRLQIMKDGLQPFPMYAIVQKEEVSMKKGMKRLVSCLLAVAMVLTTLGVNTKTASAEERTMQSYVYEGYEVDLNVTDAWDGAFNADVKIANTGDDEIRDWALTFEFAHEIQNLWNATVVEHTGDTYVIKNADWNANIKPGEAVAFGMTVLCDGEIAFPENFSFVMEEESVTAQSYSAEFTLYSDWGTGCNGAIILSNLTDKSIENWQLEFDYDREIVDIANAVIVSHEQGHYVIKNAEYNADIAANSSVHISIVAGEGAVDERPENFSMQQTVVENSTTGGEGGNEEKPDEPDSVEAILLCILGKYNAENHSIDMEWYTNAIEAAVTVWDSEDNVTYEQVATVTDVTTYQYVITKEFENKYFKASVKKENGDVSETVPFVVVKNENGYSVSLLDSDNDGVADEYELLAETDVNKPDTDGDMLTDYEELYITQTDATKYDSVTEGLSDAEADSDGDKLSNREEIEYATDVQSVDTDNDALTDYEELKVYTTDPLKSDTDGDTLKDGDELALGLDPLNPMTFGVPDAEYTVEQTISADSEVLGEINTDENEYRLAVEVTASGYVEGNLTAKETGYAAAIQNEFMVGIASELTYSNEEGIESVTLTFELDEEVIGDSLDVFPEIEELTGIKRFNVFKYFEELNMLLPIETVVDEENNRIYATTDELGTYCVMDMERWLASFEVPEEVYLETSMVFSLRPEASENETVDEIIIIDCVGVPQDMEVADVISETEELVAEEIFADEPMLFTAKKAVDKTPLDVVFLLQTSGQLENTFLSQKTMIYELMVDLTAEYGRGNVRFAVITYNLSGAEFLPSTEGDIWFTTAYGLRQALNDLTYEYTSSYTDRGNAFQKLQDEVPFKENASKFIFQVMNGSTVVGNSYFDQINTCAKLEINYSEIGPKGYYYTNASYAQQVADAISSTNGISVTFGSETQYKVFMHIYNNAVPPQLEFDAIVPTGWKHIVLDGILDPDNGVNSDTDELTDWEEIDTDRISWTTDGEVILPTIQECIDFVEKPYAEEGLERYKLVKGEHIPLINVEAYIDYVLNSTYILPIHSDPTEEDSDGDGWEDYDDSEPLMANTNLDEEMSEALMDELNDWLNQIMPPKYNEDGELITNKNKECMTTWNHFNEYLWPALLENGDNPNQRYTAYIVWLRDAYGPNGLEKMWLTFDRYVEAFYYEVLDESTVERAFKQVTLGNYYEDVTITGTAGQIYIGFLGVDFVADIRDITYDFDHWEPSWKHMGQTVVDLAALLPVIGAFKYMDEFKALQRVSSVESVRVLDDLTMMANKMSQMGHNFDEITEMGQIALRTRKIELVTEQITSIVGKYDIFECEECAKDIRKLLKNSGEDFEVLDIRLGNIEGMSNEVGIIWSDKIQAQIANTGFHTGTLYNGKVYDNVNSVGVSMKEWLSDFIINYGSGTVDLWQLYQAGKLKL